MIKGSRSFCQISKARFLFHTMLNKATGGSSNVYRLSRIGKEKLNKLSNVC